MFFLLALFVNLIVLNCDVIFACDFCHIPFFYLKSDVHIPFSGSPMAPTHDAPLAYVSS
jgi:hypothetical protein